MLFFSAYQAAGDESMHRRMGWVLAEQWICRLTEHFQLSAWSSRALAWPLITQIAEQVLKMTHRYSLLIATSWPLVLISVSAIRSLLSSLCGKGPYLSCWQCEMSNRAKIWKGCNPNKILPYVLSEVQKANFKMGCQMHFKHFSFILTK